MSGFTFENNKGDLMELDGDLTIADLVKMGVKDIRFVAPAAPLADGEWRNGFSASHPFNYRLLSSDLPVHAYEQSHRLDIVRKLEAEGDLGALIRIVQDDESGVVSIQAGVRKRVAAAIRRLEKKQKES